MLSEVAGIRIDLPVNDLSENPPWLALLIKRALAGDTLAFDQIMIHSQQKVMALSWRMLGNEADARDASQEVFLRVYKYLGRFKQDQDFFAWLYRITVNVCHDIARKRQQHSGPVNPDMVNEVTLGVPANHKGSDEALIAGQQRQLIASAMSMLPTKERAAILLRDIEGLPTEEVARILKSSSTTVRSQISSARRKIKLHCERYLKTKGAVTP